jgi:hypothetical protein
MSSRDIVEGTVRDVCDLYDCLGDCAPIGSWPKVNDFSGEDLRHLLDIVFQKTIQEALVCVPTVLLGKN